VGHYGLAGVAGPKWKVVLCNDSKIFKQFEIIWLKVGFPLLENFKIKYGCEGFEERNNFLYRNFSILKMDFKWKIREISRVWIWLEFDEISSWNFKIGWNLDQGLIIAPSD
jgi:hypothetical protein